MYYIDETENTIAIIQHYLLIISQKETSIPNIVVDGVYNEETRNGIRQFQINKGIDVTGKVNEQTFKLLVLESEAILNENNNRNNVISQEKFPLKLGDSGNDINILNTILRELADDYLDIIILPFGNFFSRETLNAVLVMQKIFRVKETGIVDFNLMERLKEEVNIRNNFKNRLKPS